MYIRCRIDIAWIFHVRNRGTWRRKIPEESSEQPWVTPRLLPWDRHPYCWKCAGEFLISFVFNLLPVTYCSLLFIHFFQSPHAHGPWAKIKWTVSYSLPSHLCCFFWLITPVGRVVLAASLPCLYQSPHHSIRPCYISYFTIFLVPTKSPHHSIRPCYISCFTILLVPITPSLY